MKKCFQENGSPYTFSLLLGAVWGDPDQGMSERELSLSRREIPTTLNFTSPYVSLAT